VGLVAVVGCLPFHCERKKNVKESKKEGLKGRVAAGQGWTTSVLFPWEAGRVQIERGGGMEKGGFLLTSGPIAGERKKR